MSKKAISFPCRLLAGGLLSDAAVAVMVLVCRLEPESGRGIPCVCFTLTGLFCPGCGSGRAFSMLMQGDFIRAFHFNPFTLILMPCLILYGAARLIDWVITGQNHIDRHIPSGLLFGIFVLLMIFGVLRNIPVVPFSWLKPGG